MTAIKEYKQKTIFIKQFIPLKLLLEAAKPKDENFLKFGETVEAFRGDLERQLSPEEINKLKLLRMAVPPNGIILLMPELKYPIIGFNLDSIPALFEKPGWLFHATTDLALNSCAQDGFLHGPLEMILEKKEYLSDKFKSDASLDRLKWGIPFAFQNAVVYQSYIQRVEKQTVLGFGGFFIFPVGYVLVEDSILQFGGMDGFPEIDWFDPAQNRWAGLIGNLLLLKKKYDQLLDNFNRSKRFFDICRINFEKLRMIVKAMQLDQVEPLEWHETIYLLHSNTKRLDPVEGNKRAYILMQQKMGSRYGTFVEGLRHSYERGEEKKYRRYAEILDHYQIQAAKTYYAENSLLSGNDEFFRGIYGFAYSKASMGSILKAVEDQDFFTFLLFTNHFYFEYDKVPTYSVYGKQDEPTFLKGTIFHSYPAFYIAPSVNDGNRVGMYLLVEFQKMAGRTTPDAINHIKKLKPEGIKVLIESTRIEVIKSIEIIVPRSRKAKPIKLSISTGVLFLTEMWYNLPRYASILRKLISAGTPILIGFECDQNVHIKEEEVTQVVHNLLRARDLPVLESYWRDQGYLFSKGESPNKEIWYKHDSQELRLA